jgi:hypothetical protein
MTEQFFKNLYMEKSQEELRDYTKQLMEESLHDPSLRSERIEARKIYRELLFFQHDTRQKKELWRRLGKCLSLNDFEFEVINGRDPVIKEVSSIKLKDNDARALSVDCLRSFCAKLAIGKSGRMKKRELLKVMSDVSALVRSKLSSDGMEKHRKVQEFIWSEDIPRGWDVPPKSPKSIERSTIETDAKNLDKDLSEDEYEMNVGSEEGTSSVYTSDNLYDNEEYEDDDNRGETHKVIDLGSRVYGKRIVYSNDELSTTGHMIDLNQKNRRNIDRETKQKSDAASNRVRIDALKRERDETFEIDVTTEKEKEAVIRYYIDVWEQYKIKSGECQAHITTLVEL